MKSMIVAKLLTLLAFVALFGQFIVIDHQQWLRLAHDVFLSYQAHRLDDSIAGSLGLVSANAECCASQVPRTKAARWAAFVQNANGIPYQLPHARLK